MRAAWWKIVWVLAGCVMCGGVELKLPEKVRPIMDMVNAAPPEFGAAAIERLLESAHIDDVPTRRVLIEQAYQLGALAKDPWRPFALPDAGYAAGMHAHAGDLLLDRLSLQLAAVQLMLPIDKHHAREMYLDIPKPTPPPLTCDDGYGGDFGEFYRTLALILGETFTRAEKRHEDDIHLAIDYLNSIASPMQLLPALRMVVSLNMNPEEKHLLLVQLGSAMAAVQADDRSFLMVSAGLSVDVPRELVPSYQRFVASRANAAPCAVAKKDDEAQSAEEKQIASDEMKLMFKGGSLVSPGERQSADWERRFDEFLNGMADWRQGDGESDSAYYHRRMTVYESLLDVSSGATRARLIDEMVGFAIQSNLLREAPAEWYFELKNADDHVRGSSANGPDVLDGFDRSGHPVLVLASALDRLLGRR